MFACSVDAGYHLRMIKNDECDVDNVLNEIKRYIPVKIERNFGQELSLLIETSDLSQFPATFDMLERNKNKMEIVTFGLSVTNMEDVFLRFALTVYQLVAFTMDYMRRVQNGNSDWLFKKNDPLILMILIKSFGFYIL